MPERTLTDSPTITWDEGTASQLRAHIHPAEGQMFLISNAVATTLVEDTWTKVAGTTLENDIQVLFTKPVTGRLVYTGTETVVMRIAVSFSVLAASNGQTLEFAVFQNDVLHEESVMQIVMTGPSASDRGAINLVAEFDTNDYVELWMRNITSSANATVNSMQFVVG